MDIPTNLRSLSRDLSLSSTKPIPEEYIKQTLLAHGFFKHSLGETSEGQSSEAKTKDKQAACGITEEDRKRTTQLICQVKEGKEIHRLKEPRNLFKRSHNRNTETNKHLPFWPIDVECIPRRPKLHGTPPTSPEPFYVPPEQDVISPKIRSGDKQGTMVYINPRGPEKYFVTARAGPSRNVKCTLSRGPDDVTLIFESRFESGNLAKAVQVGKWDYELYLSFDLYTKKHTQWFYFSVKNMRKDQTYRFTIVNLYKAGSLYNEGLQPVMYSMMEAKASGVGWRRRGHNIKYFKTPLKRVDTTKQESCYFGLTWSHTFEHDNDTCYFAHCYPYTYTDLQDYLQKILSNPIKSEFCKKRVLCHTLAGNPVPLLTITSPIKSPQENAAKRAVVVTSRVHPGETNGSWMMKGLLDLLTGNSPDAKTLRDSFVFKVIPMMNPDGVIVGNYRCSLSGRDLNRNYRTKFSDAYPTVWHTKAMVKKLAGERKIVLYCDLHGHSRKQNVFIYGCDSMDDTSTRLKSRIFPKMLCKNTPSMFSYKSSRFGVHKSKFGTGRVVMWREMGVTNSYTMEATFCGSLLGKMSRFQFRSKDFEHMGHHLCDTLLDYCDPDQTKVQLILRQLEEEYRESVLIHLASLGQSIPPGVDPLDIKLPDPSALESSDGGSDSSESDGPPLHYMAKERKKKKKMKLKSRRERNRRKAVLKLSHYNKLETPPISNISHTSNPQPHSVAVPPSSSHVHLAGGSKTGLLLSGMGEVHVPKNGGMPIFIQERLDEKQRRKSDLESIDGSTSMHMDNVNHIAREYLKQGLPPHQADIDPRSSAVYLSRSSDCPISITSMALCGSGRGTRAPSMVSSRTSLPQLIDAPRTHGTFTSNYLANHLQDMMSASPPDPQHPHQGPSSSHGGASNNTRNLANLSKLFRQLRPHLVKTDQQIERPESVLDSRTTNNPSRLEFRDFSRSTINADHHDSSEGKDRTLGDDKKINSKLLAKKLREHLEGKKRKKDQKRQLHSSGSGKSGSEPLVPNDSSQESLNPPPLPPNPLVPKPPPDHYSSLSSLGGGRASSSLTNSWDGYTKPQQITEQRPEKESRKLSHTPEDQPPPSSHEVDRHKKKITPLPKSIITPVDPIPPTKQLTPITEHIPYISKHHPTSSTSSFVSKMKPTNMSAAIIEHKRHVSEAVDNLHSDKRRRGYRKVRKGEGPVSEEDVPISSNDRIHSTLNHVGSTNHTLFSARPHPLITDEDLDGRGSKNSSSDVKYAYENNNSTVSSNYGNEEVGRAYGRDRLVSTLLGVERGVVSPDEEVEYYRELEDNVNRRPRRYTPSSVSRSESKPPSRSGPRTNASGKKGVYPSGHERSRPSTVFYDRKKQRPSYLNHHL